MPPRDVEAHAVSPVFAIAVALLVALFVGLALCSRRRSQSNWTAVSIIVGIVAVVIATGLFLVIVVLAVGEGTR